MSKITLIGLGSAGCKVVNNLSKYPEYSCFYMDTDNPHFNGTFLEVKEQTNPEQYEQQCIDYTEHFKNVNDIVYFFLSGSGKISGATLKILKTLKHKELHIVYIRPEIKLLSNLGTIQERIVYNVLQQYTRSGLFKSMLILSNQMIESSVGNMPIIGYFDKLNEIISESIHMKNYLKNTVPALNNIQEPKITSRIYTIGLYDIQDNKETMYYPINNVTDVQYLFVLNDNTLNNDGQFFKNIRERMKEKITEQTKISYSIHSSDSENYCYLLKYSDQIQE